MASVSTVYPDGYLGQVMTGALDAYFLAKAFTSDRNGSSFWISAGEGDYILKIIGTGFSYGSDGFPTRGTIFEISVSQRGTPEYTLTGLSVAASAVQDWVRNHPDDPSPLFAGNDSLVGGSSTEYFEGGLGHDVLMGGSNADQLAGGAGNDHLYGQSPGGGLDLGDTLNGGDGNDYIQGNAGRDVLYGDAGSDRINGGADEDRIYGDDLSWPEDRAIPGGNDTVNGNLGNDTISGGNGNDLLRGGQGDDKIAGDGGNDRLLGDKGNDTLFGGLGLDEMTGGEGRDTFYLQGPNAGTLVGIYVENGGTFTTSGPEAFLTDVITDFTLGEDFLRSRPGDVEREIYAAGSASDFQSALLIAEQLFSTEQPDFVAISVGNDSYVFDRFDSSNINTAVKLLGISAYDLRDSIDVME